MRRRTFLKSTLATVALALSAASVTLRTAVAEICCKVAPRRRAIRLPPLPKWNRTTDDIDFADYVCRSQDCERALLPPNLVFPHAGQIWEAVRDCQVPVPILSGPNGPVFRPDAQLRQGARVRILTLDHPAKPLAVKFQPVRDQTSNGANSPHGLHFELWLRTAGTLLTSRGETGFFTELFRPVEDGA